MSFDVLSLVYLGRKVNNLLEDATSTWDSTTAHNLVVPTGMRWIVIGGGCNRDANATMSVNVYDVADKKLCSLDVAAAGTGYRNVPNNVNSSDQPNFSLPLILDAGEYIRFFFGAAQGAGAFLSMLVIEIPMV